MAEVFMYADETGNLDYTGVTACGIVVPQLVEAGDPVADGLRYNSRFAGAPCLALFPPAASAMPARPAAALPLDHPDLTSRIAGAARRLGYAVI